MGVRDAGLRYGAPGARVSRAKAVFAIHLAPAFEEQVGVVTSFDEDCGEVQNFSKRGDVEHCAYASMCIEPVL